MCAAIEYPAVYSCRLLADGRWRLDAPAQDLYRTPWAKIIGTRLVERRTLPPIFALLKEDETLRPGGGGSKNPYASILGTAA
jgi:hypothetical protein